MMNSNAFKSITLHSLVNPYHVRSRSVQSQIHNFGGAFWNIYELKVAE